jgi:rhodanese-related sulfurtransferase
LKLSTRKTIVILLSSLVLLLTGCSSDKGAKQQTAQPTAQPASPVQQQPYQQASQQPPQQTGVRTITPAEANSLIASRKDLLLIDVRQPNELREGSIPGSQLIPFMQVARGQHSIPRGRPILVICAVGGRSIVAAQLLNRRQGYKEVYNLKGGIAAWKRAGLPVQ